MVLFTSKPIIYQQHPPLQLHPAEPSGPSQTPGSSSLQLQERNSRINDFILGAVIYYLAVCIWSRSCFSPAFSATSPADMLLELGLILKVMAGPTTLQTDTRRQPEDRLLYMAGTSVTLQIKLTDLKWSYCSLLLFIMMWYFNFFLGYFLTFFFISK